MQYEETGNKIPIRMDELMSFVYEKLDEYDQLRETPIIIMTDQIDDTMLEKSQKHKKIMWLIAFFFFQHLMTQEKVL